MNTDEADNNPEAKPTNPKDFQGLKKIPYHLFPMTAIAVGAVQMLDGGGKYGRENYREKGVLASIYYDAAIRHLNDWFAGEDVQTDNGLHHLGGALASIAILIDAIANDKLKDNRCYTNKYAKLAEHLAAETVRLTEKHKDKHPLHYTKLLLKEDAHWYCDRSKDKKCTDINRCNLHNRCMYPQSASTVDSSKQQ